MGKEIIYSIKERNIILSFAFFASFMATFMGSSVNIALPEIAKEFNLNAITLSWVSLSFLLAAAVTNLPAGWISDLYSKKKIILIGLLIYILAMIITIMSKNTFFLLLSRVLNGLTGPFVFASSTSLLIYAFPKEQRGGVIGINSAAVYLGLSTGPFFGGFLSHNLGWRSIFIFILVICVILFFYLALKVKEDKTEKLKHKFDWTGIILYAFSVVLLIYGLSNITEKAGKIFTITGFLGLITFIAAENNVKHPVLPINLFSENITFLFSNLSALIHYTATFGITFLLSLYFQYIRGLTPQNAGIIIMAQPLIMMLFSPLSGKLSDKIEPAYLASFGMALTATGVLALSFIDKNTEFFLIILMLFLTGFGFAFFSSPNTNAVMSSVDKLNYGIATGILGTMRLVGQMLGLAISTMIFSIFLGKSKIKPENFDAFMKSMKILFIIFFILSMFGTFASLMRGKIRGNVNNFV